MQAVEKRKRTESGGNEGESRITRARREDEMTAEEGEVEEFFTILRRMHMAASYLGYDKGKLEGSAEGVRWKGSFMIEDFFETVPVGDHSRDGSERKGQEDCRPKEDRKEGEEEGKTAVYVKAANVRRGFDLNMDPEAEPGSPLNLQGGPSISTGKWRME